MELLKENEMGKTYQAEGCKLLYRIEGSVSGDNDINVEEDFILVNGSVEITLNDKTWTLEAPATFSFPAKTFHKIKALTDISLVMFEK